MAHSKNFFSNRSGSTSSHTYSNVRGEQITKDRQPVPANPRTLAQLRQRMIVRLCQNAARELRPIISQSFDNVPAGQASVREFLRINQKKGSLDVVSWAKKDSYIMFFADFQICNSSINNFCRPYVSTEAGQYSFYLNQKLSFNAEVKDHVNPQFLFHFFSKLTYGLEVEDIYFFYGTTLTDSEEDYNLSNNIVHLNKKNVESLEVLDEGEDFCFYNNNFPIEFYLIYEDPGLNEIYFNNFSISLSHSSKFLSYANTLLRINYKGHYKFLSFGWQLSDYQRLITFNEALQTYL